MIERKSMQTKPSLFEFLCLTAELTINPPTIDPIPIAVITNIESKYFSYSKIPTAIVY